MKDFFQLTEIKMFFPTSEINYSFLNSKQKKTWKQFLRIYLLSVWLSLLYLTNWIPSATSRTFCFKKRFKARKVRVLRQSWIFALVFLVSEDFQQSPTNNFPNTSNFSKTVSFLIEMDARTFVVIKNSNTEMKTFFILKMQNIKFNYLNLHKLN